MKPKLLLLTLLLALTLAVCTPARSEPESGSEASAPSSQAEEQPSEPSSSVQESSSEPAAPEESSAPDWAAGGICRGRHSLSFRGTERRRVAGVSGEPAGFCLAAAV